MRSIKFPQRTSKSSLVKQAWNQKLINLYNDRIRNASLDDYIVETEDTVPKLLHNVDSIIKSTSINQPLTTLSPLSQLNKSQDLLFHEIIRLVNSFDDLESQRNVINKIVNRVEGLNYPFVRLLSSWKKSGYKYNYEWLVNDFIKIRKQCKEEQVFPLCFMVLYIFIFNNKPLAILVLNSLWINVLNENPKLKNVYYDIYFRNLINTDQQDLLSFYLTDMIERNDDVDQLPVKAIIKSLVTRQDLNTLNKYLPLLNKERLNEISNEQWQQILDVSLMHNNYKLVEFTYKNFIMINFKEGKITLDDVILSDKLSSEVFSTFTDNLIYQILHTFSTNGDIKSTLELIESHYLYKSVKGEKALSNELCIKIIESYCYNKELQSDNDGMIKILELIEVFVIKCKDTNVEMFCNDVFQAVSAKLKNVKANIHNNQHEEEMNHQGDNSLVLAKHSTLDEFISMNFKYCLENNFTNETITIFVNCLLNFDRMFLNFSGQLFALESFHYINREIRQNLDQISFKLILKSLSHTDKKKCSLIIYKYLLQMKISITPEMYMNFIEVGFRSKSSDALKFYITNYINDYPQFNLQKLRKMYANFPFHDPSFSNFMESLSNFKSSTNEISDVWQYDLTESRYDLKESKILEKILTVS